MPISEVDRDIARTALVEHRRRRFPGRSAAIFDARDVAMVARCSTAVDGDRDVNLQRERAREHAARSEGEERRKDREWRASLRAGPITMPAEAAKVLDRIFGRRSGEAQLPSVEAAIRDPNADTFARPNASGVEALPRAPER